MGPAITAGAGVVTDHEVELVDHLAVFNFSSLLQLAHSYFTVRMFKGVDLVMPWFMK